MSDNEIIQRLSISKTTFYNTIRKLISLGVITKIDGGYLIDHDLFPCKDWDKIEEYREMLDNFAEKDPKFSSSKTYRTFNQYYQGDFADLKMPLGDFLPELQAGLISRNPESQVKENSKEPVVYSF